MFLDNPKYRSEKTISTSFLAPFESVAAFLNLSVNRSPDTVLIPRFAFCVAVASDDPKFGLVLLTQQIDDWT